MLAVMCGLYLSSILGGCSSPSTKKTEGAPTAKHSWKQWQGKKIAFIEVVDDLHSLATPTNKRIIEVALINQLAALPDHLVLVAKSVIEAAKLQPQQNPLDWEGIARAAGADVAVRARVLQMTVDRQAGFVNQAVVDSQWQAEQGNDAQRLAQVAVQGLRGHVEIGLEWLDFATQARLSLQASASAQTEQKAETEAIHLPPMLRFLENLTNKAFKDCFSAYN